MDRYTHVVNPKPTSPVITFQSPPNFFHYSLAGHQFLGMLVKMVAIVKKFIARIYL